MTDPRPASGSVVDDASGSVVDGASGSAADGASALTGDDVVLRVQSAADGIAGVSDGPLAEAVPKLDALHRELQGTLADLDQA
ncbi:MAG: hypothetical protein ABI047_06985 [Jatrophihabitantaceae bacterium]